MPRAHTWVAEDGYERRGSKQAAYVIDDDSEEERHARRSRRHKSPHGVSYTYAVNKETGRTHARTEHYPEEQHRSAKANYGAYPEANTGRPIDRGDSFTRHMNSGSFPKVKEAKNFDYDDVAYSNIGHTAHQPTHAEMYGYA
jgi:hypothetical protein